MKLTKNTKMRTLHSLAVSSRETALTCFLMDTPDTTLADVQDYGDSGFINKLTGEILSLGDSRSYYA